MKEYQNAQNAKVNILLIDQKWLDCVLNVLISYMTIKTVIMS
ncbi:MAG: hypothetical protein ACI8YQ_005098 [Polaribacter sp.]|jgi:hypothetical protein